MLQKLKRDLESDHKDQYLHMSQNIQGNQHQDKKIEGHDENVFKELEKLSKSKCGSPDNLLFYPRYSNPYDYKV